MKIPTDIEIAGVMNVYGPEVREVVRGLACQRDILKHLVEGAYWEGFEDGDDNGYNCDDDRLNVIELWEQSDTYQALEKL